jgi:hypothetical protein
VIEFNPRLASQFGDLYRRVLGVDPHAMALALATGGDPREVPRAAPSDGVAASLVWRAFDAASLPPAPAAARRAALAGAFPDALLTVYSRSGGTLRRDFKWLDSHRYGVVNLGAPDWSALRQHGARIAALLGWPDAPYAGELPTAAADGELASAFTAAE